MDGRFGGTRRDKDQIQADRVLIAQWHHQGYTDAEVAAMLQEATGRVLSRRAVNLEIHHLRKQWLNEQQKSYSARMAEELHRLDILEREIWAAMRSSVGEKTRTDIEKVARKLKSADSEAESDEQWEMFTRRILQSIEVRDINPVWFDRILAVQNERRKLLGLYPTTSQTQNIQVNVIKGYDVSVDPGAWPDPTGTVIDGEFKRLPPTTISAD